MAKHLLSLIIFILAACEDPGNYNYKDCGEVFDLKENESVTIKCGTSEEGDNNVKSITVKDLEIEDSRCCMACICISSGSAKATFVLASDKSEKLVELSIGETKDGYLEEDSAIIELDNHNYNIILKDIHPFPETVSDEKPKFAKLQVKY